MGKVVTVWGSSPAKRQIHVSAVLLAKALDLGQAESHHYQCRYETLCCWSAVYRSSRPIPPSSARPLLSSGDLTSLGLPVMWTVLKKLSFIGMMGYVAGGKPAELPRGQIEAAGTAAHSCCRQPVDFGPALTAAIQHLPVNHPAAIEAGDVSSVSSPLHSKGHQSPAFSINLWLVDERFRFLSYDIRRSGPSLPRLG